MTKRTLQRTDACQMPCWSDSPPGPIKKKLCRTLFGDDSLVTPEKLNRFRSPSPTKRRCFSVAQTKPDGVMDAVMDAELRVLENMTSSELRAKFENKPLFPNWPLPSSETWPDGVSQPTIVCAVCNGSITRDTIFVAKWYPELHSALCGKHALWAAESCFVARNSSLWNPV